MKRFMALAAIPAMVLLMGFSVMAKVVPVDLKPYLNAPGVSPLDVEVPVGLDVDNGASWASFDAAYFPKGGGEVPSNMGDFRFVLPDPLPEKDNVECQGQEIAVAPGSYMRVLIAATNHHGDSEDAPITLKYEDGSVESAKFSVTDWCAAAKFDEVAVLDMDHRVNLDGSEHTINCYLWGVSVKANPDKRLVAVILPKDTEDFQAWKLHVFAMGLETK